MIFGKEPDAMPFFDPGKVAQANSGEKLTATDPTSGDLLFYSDGVNIYDATHQIMVNGDGISTDPAAVQGMSVSPIPGPGNESLYYLIHRDNTGTILYTVVDMSLQGNRSDGLPVGEVRPAQKNVPAGINSRGDGMLTLASGDMSTFWVITQNSGDGNFEIHEVPPFAPGGVTFSAVGLLDLTVDIEASHLAYHPASAKIAIVPTNDVNIQIVDFNEGPPELVFNAAVANSFVPSQTFGGSAGWSFDGQKLFFSRNTATEGNLYRVDLMDPLASVEPVFNTPIGESLSLLLAPDSTVYHIYSETQGGDRLLGRINQPDSALVDLMYEGDVFMGQTLGSNYFSQFGPERNIMPQVVISFQGNEICPENPVQFFSQFTPPTAEPSSYNWDFQPVGLMSNQRAPIMTFTEAGMLTVTLNVEINGRTIPSNTLITEVIESDLQVSLSDTTICEGETLELDADPASGGGMPTGGPFTYLWSTGESTAQINVTEAGNYWVVVTPTTGCPVYASAGVQVYGDMNPVANIWYFGNGAGLDFNEEDGLPPPPRSIAEAHAMDAPEGTSTMSDRNGDVLFYTDGRTVWNRENGVMPNGTAIGGDSTSAQSVVIIPFADDDTQYYVFTTEEVYGENNYLLKYSVVDMKEDDGRGNVIVKDITLFSRSTERLIAVDGSWLVAHEYGNNTFRAYPITADGIGAPVLSSEGSVHSLNDEFSGQASMKFSADATNIAVALIEGNDDYVELFEFDGMTGEITEFEYRIDLNEGGPALNDQVYDVHFSPGAQKVFASMNNRNRANPGGRILEYRIDSLSTADSRLASRTDITQGSGLSHNIGAMQTGPDGQIYVAVETPGNPGNSAFVSSIAASEDTLQASGFNPQQVILSVGNSRLGLPNYVYNNQDQLMSPSMSAPDTTCVDQRIELTGGGTSDIDEFLWRIVEEATNTTVFSAPGMDTAYVFPQGQQGRFNVSLNIFNRCGFDTTLVQTIDVFDIPAPPSIPSAVSICEGDVEPLNANASNTPGLTFEWTDSQGNVVSNSALFTVTDPEIYTVTITNAGGCTSTGSVFAGPPFEISLPEAQTICQNDPLTLDPQVTAFNYVWTVLNPDNSTTSLPNQQRADVNSSIPGVYTYVVSIEDPITPGCFVNDSTVVTIGAIPMATASNIVNVACGDSNGSFDFNLTTSGSYTYEVTDNSGTVVDQNSAFNGPGPATVSGLSAGIYSVQFTDNSSGCTGSLDNVQIESTAPDFTITNVALIDADCTNPTGSITVTLSPNVFPISYTLTNTTTGVALPPVSGVAGTTDFTISNIPGGTYNLVVTSSGGCTQSSPGIMISTPTDAQLTTEPFLDICGANAPLTATTTSAGVILTWTGPGGFNQVDNGSVTTTVSGIYTVTATHPTNAFCPVSQEVEVNLAIQPIVTISGSDTECDGTEVLTAQVTNPQAGVTYVYNWSNGATGASITVDTDGTYDVTVRESTNLTCTGTASEGVTFPVPLEATLTSTPPCDDGQPITLTVDVTSGTATSFSWSRDGTAISGNSNEIIVNDEGSYLVRINAGTCFIERGIEIRRSPIPEGLLPDEGFYCPSRTNNETFIAGEGFASYEWTLDGQPFPDGGQVLEVTAAGLYEVTMTTAQGCIRVDQIEVIESCDPVVLAPNVIVPSSTPPNNVFSVVPNDFVDQFEIFIYSRWGELIYQSNSAEFKWDGTLDGEIVPLGTYPYIIRFTSRFEPERGTFEQLGSVVVVR